MRGELNIEIARRIGAAMNAVTDRPRPCLIYINNLGGTSREARIYLAEHEEIKGTCSRIAGIATSPLARIIGNFFIGFNKRTIPTQLFTDEAKAIEWLLLDS